MRIAIPSTLLALVCCAGALAQSEPEQIKPILTQEVLRPVAANSELRQYIVQRIAAPPAPTSAKQWTEESARLRKQLLEVAFHGWPKEWVDAPARFEEAGIIETGAGYRIRKLRYDIVPGFQSVALLYEPEKLAGKAPAILNVNGHVGPPGKSVEYKQKRCINFAKRGILALNVEWMAFGELGGRENQHSMGAHLDLAGANELGLFILAMRRGLDYLYDHPSVDRERIGVTGLSGGGWQTITLSSLDERVKAAVPVAGFSSLRTRVEVREHGDLGDIEQAATDFLIGVDFTHLAAMMAPRPTLLIYNAEDDCCFRGPMVKPLIYNRIKPVFGLYGKESLLQWHENRDPGTHNYQLDNRLAAYRFFAEQFKMPAATTEIPSAGEIKSYEELTVGLRDNSSILGIARKLASEIRREPVPTSSARAAWADAHRKTLRETVRYKPVKFAEVWGVANTKNKGVESIAYLFKMAGGLSLDGVLVKAIQSPENAPGTIVIRDEGKQAAEADVSDRVNRGEQVLAADLLFLGHAWETPAPDEYAQILNGLGERPLGIQAAQLIELARWLAQRSGTPKVRLETTGIRTQIIAQVAAALEPGLFSEIVAREGMPSLGYLLQKPVLQHEAPELFCLDLYKNFDVDRLQALAEPAHLTISMRSQHRD